MKKGHSPKKAASTTVPSNCNSYAAQRQRMIEALRTVPGGITTLEFREQYDVMAPAPRVFELRHDYGHNIQKEMVRGVNAQGNWHRTALYTLQSGPWKRPIKKNKSKGGTSNE